jgi:hypothetical protein
MNANQFVRLSGWAFVLAAACLLLTFVDAPWLSAPFLFAIVLVTAGLLGLRARYGAQAGPGARLALDAGVAGGAAGVVSYFLMVGGYESGRTLMNLAMAVMFGGLFGFGLIALRTRPLPRGNALPALAGVWWPGITLFAYVVAPLTGAALSVPAWLSFALFAAMSLCLAWLGVELQASTPATRAAAR